MAIIKCTECGKEISDKAPACLGCGAPILNAASVSVVNSAPIRVVRAGFRWEAIGATILIGGLLLSIVGVTGVGGVAMLVGFIVFMVGRFIN